MVIDLGASTSRAGGSRRPRQAINSFNDLMNLPAKAFRWLGELTPPDVERFASELSSVRLLAPVPRPPKIIAAIVNTHGMLGGKDVSLDRPRLDMKAPSTVIGQGDTILAPPAGIRPEVELAAVVGALVRNATVSEARRSIFGYSILNDVTSPAESREDEYQAYRRNRDTGVVGKVPVRGPLFRSKNHDTFTPMGPCVVTKDELSDPYSLRMETRFNGEVVQEGSTSEYIFHADRVISYVSQFLTLERGDVVSLGSIGWKGSADRRNSDPSEWVLPSLEGTLELAVEGIGVLRNPVRREAGRGVGSDPERITG
jgi:2-keto-4-pentenoate hydratase/2-oxohepta-3-ene-1,7-dioic acid hydratase in catechol pathway